MTGDELQAALDHVKDALKIVSAHANELAFVVGSKGCDDIAVAEENLRVAAKRLQALRNVARYDERISKSGRSES